MKVHSRIHVYSILEFKSIQFLINKMILIKKRMRIFTAESAYVW